MRQFFKNVWEIVEVVLVAGVAVFIVRTYIAQPFLVSGASMEPNFSSGNYLFIDEISYRFQEPRRGEVIVFRYPGDERTFYIKRIIGLPDEQVMVDRGRVSINGQALIEPYLPADVKTVGAADLRLGAGEYFVLGDNRYYSFDSRQWGTLPRRDIIGLVRLRLLPISQARAFAAPQY